tara:strand:+ start:411 stop:575 length:165 start_codon:yes stop_codon:yes gene_type:complete
MSVKRLQEVSRKAELNNEGLYIVGERGRAGALAALDRLCEENSEGLKRLAGIKS